MNFSTSIKKCMTQKYLTMSGRASRSEYWYFYLFFYLDIIIMLHDWRCVFRNNIWYNFGNLLYRIGNTMFYCVIKAFARYWQVSMVFIISVDSCCWSNYTYYSFLQKGNRGIEQIWKRSFIRIISIHIKINKVPYCHVGKELYFLFKNCISF